MKDFLGFSFLLLLVLGSLILFIYLMFYVAQLAWALFQMVVSVGVIIYCIKYLRAHRIKR